MGRPDAMHVAVCRALCVLPEARPQQFNTMTYLPSRNSNHARLDSVRLPLPRDGHSYEYSSSRLLRVSACSLECWQTRHVSCFVVLRERAQHTQRTPVHK